MAEQDISELINVDLDGMFSYSIIPIIIVLAIILIIVIVYYFLYVRKKQIKVKNLYR